MPVPCPAFFFFEEDDHGSAQGQCAPGVVRGVLRFLDGAEPRLAEPLYPHLHAADGGDPRHAPDIIRTYAVSFLLLPLNIFSTYYFQAILKPGAAFFVSVARGLVISGALILLLPEVLGSTSIWWAMPVTELLVACYAVSAMRRATRALPSC